MKHAMTVQSAHMITTDYITLNQPLSEGILLHDRTDRRLKLIHSLGELQPMHTYVTEYGNVLERPAKHKCVLGGSIELEVLSDEADFDAQMGRLALSSNGAGSSQPPSTSMRMASYSAVRDVWSVSAAAPDKRHTERSSGRDVASNGHGSAYGTNDSAASTDGTCSSSSSSSSSRQANGGGHGEPGGHGSHVAGGLHNDAASSEPLDEKEALERIAALVGRVQEMEQWFTGVKAEAERERRMREQTSARLELMTERVELLHSQLVETQRENKMLRQRVADICVAHEEETVDSDDGSNSRGRNYAPSCSGMSTHSVRSGHSIRQDGFGSGSVGPNGVIRREMPLAKYHGPLHR